LEVVVKQFRSGFEPLRWWRCAVERAALKPGCSSELKIVGLSKRSWLGVVCNGKLVVVDERWSDLVFKVQWTPGAVEILVFGDVLKVWVTSRSIRKRRV
jgi:hypothetical protein